MDVEYLVHPSRTYKYTSEKQLCVLQFSAHKALHVVVTVGQINMTIITMKHFNCIKYHFSNSLIILSKISLKVKLK